MAMATGANKFVTAYIIYLFDFLQKQYNNQWKSLI